MKIVLHKLIEENRGYIMSAFIATCILLTVFKIIYPNPYMVLDSYYYILAAISHADVNAWAIGYSWFLRGFGVFSHSAFLLVCFQYLLLVGSLLVFFITYTTIFALSKISKGILWFFLFVNPLYLYCANFVMADALFLSLSGLWISLLLWVVFRPSAYLLWLHALLILAVFTVRYNAIYYPIVATVAFILSRYSVQQKMLGIGLQILVIGTFVCFTSIRVGELSGRMQFSPFGNWKTANDALYMYGHIYREDPDSAPAKFAKLHKGVQRYFASGARVDDLLDYESPFYGSVYMFYVTSPLVQYKNMLYGADTQFVNFTKMAYVGPLYGAYGSWLIRRHPWQFMKYFVFPNSARYFIPPMEAFGSLPPFFLRDDYLGQAARTWFGLKTFRVSSTEIEIRDAVLSPYQMIATLIHILFIFNIIIFMGMNSMRTIVLLEKRTLVVLIVVMILDFGFNLTAAATVMRYELFGLAIEVALGLYLVEHIYLGNQTLKIRHPGG